jgi:hypothetical protein
MHEACMYGCYIPLWERRLLDSSALSTVWPPREKWVMLTHVITAWPVLVECYGRPLGASIWKGWKRHSAVVRTECVPP